MRKLTHQYGALLRVAGVPNLLTASFVGRLPTGMGLLLFVLVVHAGTGSYTIAGVAAAADSLAIAVCGPLLGRLADRGHARRVLPATGIAEAIALIGLVLVLRAHASAVAIAAVAALAGAATPPIAAVTRTVLPRIAPDAVTTAFAVDALLLELTYLIGPSVLGLTFAAWGADAAAYLVAALALTGACWLAVSPAVRHAYRSIAPTMGLDVAGSAGAARVVDGLGTDVRISALRRFIGPLASHGMRTVMIVAMLQCAAFGVLEVAIPAYANAQGMPQASGLLFAVWSGGSICGGLWFGAQNFRSSLSHQYVVLMALNATGFGAIALATNAYTLGLVLFFAGLFIAPATTVQSSLISALTPPAWTTEAFTWWTTSICLGYALGTGAGSAVLGGRLGSSAGLTLAAVIAVSLAVIGAALTVADRRSLVAAPA